MNPYLIQQAYGIDKQQVIDNCIDVVSYAQEKGLKTTFMGWDLTRADDLTTWKMCTHKYSMPAHRSLLYSLILWVVPCPGQRVIS